MTILLMLAPNMTDYLVDLFGPNNPIVWDFLDSLFGFLGFLFPGDMWTTVWEVLFT